MEQLLEFDPPKAHANKVTPRHCWAEPKLDGVRAIVHLHPSYGVVITTRRRNKDGNYTQLQDKVPHIRDNATLQEMAIHGYTILDTELIVTSAAGSKVNSVMSIVGASPANAIAHQERHGRAKLAYFDMPRLQDEDLTELQLDTRKYRLEGLHHEFALPGLLVKHTILQGVPNEARAEYLERCLRAGYEGAMWKDPYGRYHGTSWRKEKVRVTHDLRVCGWELGQGKYAGLIGALKLEWPSGAAACQVSPGTDADRVSLSEQLIPLTEAEVRALELWVEVEAQELTASGSLRHPRIVRWRPDLASNAKESHVAS